METYKYLLDLAIILLCTKALGLATRKVQMPQVVGALLAGVLLGPAMLGILTETSFIHNVAEIGVIVLMFCAGLETDIQELKASGKASFVIALIGVIVPLIGGYATAMFFNRPGVITSDASCSVFLQNIFIGVILTATSVSITVETLKELGKLKTKSGNAILGAAIIDDVLGIVALTLVTSMADESVKISVVLLKIVAFFAFAGVIGFIFYKVFKKWTDQAEKGLRRHAIMAFVFCLLMAYVAEKFFGVADITGAFIAGLIISNTSKSDFVLKKFDTMSYMLLSPVFFASIGLKVELPKMSTAIVGFAVVLTIVAIMAFVFCLLMAYVAEKFFGVADITGAFIAGLIISNTSKSDFVLKKFDTMSYMLLSPVFFASIGLKVELPKMSTAIVGFAVVLTIVAILTKIVGCALGAKMCGYKNYQCARIGVGMISRGEVALIVASKGEALGMLGGNFLGPVIIVVVITTIITPILLKIVFKSGPNVSTLEKGKEVTSFYEDIEKKRTE